MLGITDVSFCYIRGIITSVRQDSAIDFEHVVQNLSAYFDDEELINQFKSFKEEFQEDIFWETIEECWYIIARRSGLPIVTPWLLESVRNNNNLIRFLGEPKTKIILKIMVANIVDENFDWDSPETFTYDCTEEAALGLLLVLEGNDKFLLFTEVGYDLTDGDRGEFHLDDILPNYLEKKDKYSAKIGDRIIGFDTMDFVAGIKKALLWTGDDINKYVQDVTCDGVPVTF